MTMVPQEIILSSCSTGEASGSASKASSTPSIQLHDLASFAHVHSFKGSSNSLNCLAFANSQDGVGGTVWSVQEGKAFAGVWAWQKDQQHLKLHLPERLSCIAIAPNCVWMAGGSSTGQIYLWEIASGLLLASWNAHYRLVNSLTFSSDSALLVSSSQDSAVHVFLVARLLEDDSAVPYGKPYGSLSDHTLAITSVVLGRTAGSAGGRCITAAEDGTVKLWDLCPPFDLLATFTLPPSAIPTALAFDPTERFVYVGSAEGNVYHIPLFQRKGQVGLVEPLFGAGLSTKTDLARVTLQSPVTCLALSLSATQLIIGTRSGDIHIHALPSHQHLRTLSSHIGPISSLSTLISPPDLVGRVFRSEEWPVMDIRSLERMRAGHAPKNNQEVSMVLKSSAANEKYSQLARGPLSPKFTASLYSGGSQTDEQADGAALQQEVKRLKQSLAKAAKLNDKMWSGVLDLKMGA